MSFSILVICTFGISEKIDEPVVKSYFCKLNGNTRIWSNLKEAQEYVDRLRCRMQNKKNVNVSFMIIPGII